MELLEVRPSVRLNVFPIHFDEVVTFTERERRSAVKLETKEESSFVSRKNGREKFVVRCRWEKIELKRGVTSENK